ncbi:MAG: LPS export ABC transporter permease LptG [Rhodospirillales bacterium]|nr:LPS export ABC transporter permease LptG [Rhodospirillales bacterium]
MRLSTTLLGYLGRQFAFALAGFLLVFLAIVYLFDSIELIRRAASRPSVTTQIVLKMALFKLPQMAEALAPFVVLFAAMITFWRLTRSNELTVARAAGVSVWQFLIPIVGLALLFGVFKMTVLNPAGAVLYGNYERMEAELLRSGSGNNLLSISNSGFWLRQLDAKGNSVVHARRVSSQNMELFDVIILNFEGQDKFIGRIDAATAKLEAGEWRITKAWITAPETPSRFEESYRVPTSMTAEQIQDSFASPLTISFWELPGFIRMLEAAGFSATRHRLHLHELIANPVLLAAMVLIAATFSLRPHRRGGTGLLVVSGVAVGFILFFASSLVGALGQSSAIPVALAAWTPAIVSTMLGVSMLLHLEDG